MRGRSDHPLTGAIFPSIPWSRGHYESYYLRAAARDRPAAVWIRYTVHKRPGQAPNGSLWCTLWEGDRPRAVKQTFPDPHGGQWAEIGGSSFGSTGAAGHAQAKGHTGAWELAVDGGSGAVEHLPSRWMYRGRLPRTKTLSPISDARFTGWVEVDGHRVELHGWRGMVGHNWGSEHAERWIWLHASDFAGAPEAWLDCVVGRVRLGGWTTPWIANGVLATGGKRIRLGGLPQARATSVWAHPTRAALSLPSGAGSIAIEVAAPPEQVTGWVYADPGGGEHHALHCSVAAMEVRVARPDQAPLRLTTAHGACYELGVREADHGIPLQPFPDG